VGVPGPLRLEVDELGGRLAVDGRLGVGHAGDARDPPRQGGRGAGGDGLVLLPAGLAQVDVHVDQSRADDLAGPVEGAVGVEVGAGAEAEDPVALQPEVRDLVDALGGVDAPPAGDANGAHSCTSGSSAAPCFSSPATTVSARARYALATGESG